MQKNPLLVFLTRVQDGIYLSVGLLFVLLAALALLRALFRLLTGLGHLDTALLASTLNDGLIVLILGELLETVLLFLRTHRFTLEPFLLVGIIAAVRRILVLSAQESVGHPTSAAQFYPSLWDLALSTLLVLALVFALIMTRRSDRARRPLRGRQRLGRH